MLVLFRRTLLSSPSSQTRNSHWNKEPLPYREKAPEIRTVWQVGAWLHPLRHRVRNDRSEAMKRIRRNHGATVRAQMAVAEIKGDKTVAELAEQLSVDPT